MHIVEFRAETKALPTLPRQNILPRRTAVSWLMARYRLSPELARTVAELAFPHRRAA